MKLSVCIDAVFSGRDFIEGMKAVKKAGIRAFEFWGWWDKDLERINNAKDELDMEIAAFCTKFISLVNAERHAEYLQGLRETVDVAKKMKCNTLISQVGNELSGLSRAEQHRNLVLGLKACVPILEDMGVTLVFEPLNTIVDHRGYYLYNADEAFHIIDEVGSANVKVLYDIYHQQIMEGNLISRIMANINKIGHFHAAGNPGRHELQDGEINYRNVFKAIRCAGYQGYVGLEYFPLRDVDSGLREAAGFSLFV